MYISKVRLNVDSNSYAYKNPTGELELNLVGEISKLSKIYENIMNNRGDIMNYNCIEKMFNVLDNKKGKE